MKGHGEKRRDQSLNRQLCCHEAWFWQELVGSLFGMVFTAYGFLAGLLGPWLGGYMLDATGDAFETVFTYTGVCLFLAAFLISRVRILDIGMVCGGR